MQLSKTGILSLSGLRLLAYQQGKAEQVKPCPDIILEDMEDHQVDGRDLCTSTHMPTDYLMVLS